MKKLLVTGASGFLGWNLCHQAQANWDVYGTYFNHQITVPGASLYRVDLTNLAELKQLFAQINPDAVIHLAAASQPNFCQLNRELAYQINVEAAVNIARLCGDRQIPCVFTSTDLVFDGKNPPYQEADPVCPINYYGEQKAIAEQKMSEIYPHISLCRMPLMFGAPSPASSSFLTGMINNLQAGKEINLFADEYRTPASARAASQGLLMAVKQQIEGVLHLGGKERLSRYNFGLLLADSLEISSSLIKPGKQADVTMAAPRSPDTSLDSTKAFSLGYQPWSIKEELSQILI